MAPRHRSTRVAVHDPAQHSHQQSAQPPGACGGERGFELRPRCARDGGAARSRCAPRIARPRSDPGRATASAAACRYGGNELRRSGARRRGADRHDHVAGRARSRCLAPRHDVRGTGAPQRERWARAPFAASEMSAMILPIDEHEFHLYVDGHLGEERQCVIEALLRDHPEVAARVTDYRHQNELMRQLFDPIGSAPPTDDQERLLHALGHRLGHSKLAALWRPAMATAAGLLMAAMLGAVGTEYYDE